VKLIRPVVEQIRDVSGLGLFFPLRHVSDLVGRPMFQARVRGAGRIAMRRNSTDADVVRQVFRKREYDFSGTAQYRAVCTAYGAMLEAGETPLILDIGANIGASAIWFARAFPRARIVTVEPDPGNAAMCRRNTARLPNVKNLQAAIGGAPGSVSLANQTDAWAVQTIRDAAGTVPVVTIPSIVQAEGKARLLMVKIDIEGFEADLFDGDCDWLNDVHAVLIEPHDWMLPGRHTSRGFQRAMAAHEFEMLVSGENLIYVACEPPSLRSLRPPVLPRQAGIPVL